MLHKLRPLTKVLNYILLFYEQPGYGYYRKLNDINAAFNPNRTLTLKVSEQFLESWESAFSDIPRLRLMIPMNYHHTEL